MPTITPSLLSGGLCATHIVKLYKFFASVFNHFLLKCKKHKGSVNMFRLFQYETY